MKLKAHGPNQQLGMIPGAPDGEGNPAPHVASVVLLILI